MVKLLLSGCSTILLALSVLAAPALAAGGGGSGGSGGGGDGGTAGCPTGQVYDDAKNKCVPKSSSLDTDTLFENGRALAYAGRYDEAISVLKLAEDRGDPRIFNMLGYSNRKQGKLLIALGYYEEALRIDPDHVLTREYLGEAHLQMGDVASAKQELGEIEKRAGRDSAEYAELSRQIAAYEAANG